MHILFAPLSDAIECNQNEYKCEGEPKCIPTSQLCDSVPHCQAGDDESVKLCSKYNIDPKFSDIRVG